MSEVSLRRFTCKVMYHTKSVTVRVPLVPNFVRIDDKECLPVGELSDAALKLIASMWTRDLLANARKQREIRDAKV